MNILLLTTHLNVGGITSYALSLGKGLKGRGHTVYIASSGGEALTRFTEQGLVFIPIPIRTKSEANIFKIGVSFWKLCRHIREKDIQIVHSNTRVTQVLGSLLKKKAGVAHVTTWHGFFKNRIVRRLFPCWAERIIAISESVKDHLIKDLHAEEQAVRLIYNGIDLERLRLREPLARSQVKEDLGLGQGPVIGIIARLSDVKGHVHLIRAMKRVVTEFADARLLIVGEGKMQGQLEALVRGSGIEDGVVFMPKAPDISQVLYCIDVFVMPSLKEGLGLGLMEAMAWGKAVIGSDVGGIRNLIRHNQNGLLVKPADPDGLALAIAELLRDPLRASLLGAAAQRFIKENFSLEKMVEETEGVYRECLGTKSSSSPDA